MKIKLSNIKMIIRKKFELFFLITLSLISIIIMQIFNFHKNTKNQNYLDLINNSYFQKTFNHVLESMQPKYKNIKHTIAQGETFDKIFEKYKISKEEIKIIKKILVKKIDINKLKKNQIIEFTIDLSKKHKITNLFYPVSRTKKINITKNLDKNYFESREIITNLTKKIIFVRLVIISRLSK